MPHQRLLWIDALKGLCILMVVLYHVVQQVDIHAITPFSSSLIDISDRAWSFFNWALSPLRMPVFFALSGWLAARHINAAFSSPDLVRHVVVYLWVFVVWSLILWLITYIIGYFTDFRHPFYARGDLAFFSCSLYDFFYNLLVLNTGHWYIYALAIYYVLAAIFVRVKWLFFATALLLFFLSFSPSFFEVSWATLSIIRNCVFFLLGAYWGKKLLVFITDFKFFAAATLLMGLVLTYLSFSLLSWDIRLLGSFSGVLFCWLVAIQINPWFSHPVLSWLMYLGKNTLYIYVLQMAFIQAATLFFSSPSWLAVSRHEWLYLLAKLSYPMVFTTIVIFLCIAVARLCRRYLPVLFMPPYAAVFFATRGQWLGKSEGN